MIPGPACRRSKAEQPAPRGSPGNTVEILTPPGSPVFKQRWAELIKKVSEADPLLCPRGWGTMGIIISIEQREVTEKILTHLAL